MGSPAIRHAPQMRQIPSILKLHRPIRTPSTGALGKVHFSVTVTVSSANSGGQGGKNVNHDDDG